MVSSSRIVEGQPRSRGLLDASEQFEVYTLDGDELVSGRIEYANLATVDNGVLEFWHVVDDVWHQVAVFAPGYWSSFIPVEKKQRDAVAPPEAPAMDPEPFEYQQDTVEARLTVETPERSIKNDSQANGEMRAKIRNDLARGVFPTDELENLNGVIRPPAKLKDVWQGKGEATDDGGDEDTWPMNGTQADIDEWVAKRNVKEEARVASLRVQSDAEFEKHPQPADRLPEHLKDASVPPPSSDYTTMRVPYTTMVGADGSLPTRSDRDGKLVEPPAEVVAYSEKVASSVQDAIAYGRQQREIVEDWHGKSSQSQ